MKRVLQPLAAILFAAFGLWLLLPSGGGTYAGPYVSADNPVYVGRPPVPHEMTDAPEEACSYTDSFYRARPASFRSSERPTRPARPAAGEVQPDSEGIHEPDPQEITVYVTRTGEKYHRSSCQHLSKSKIPMTLSEAIRAGYTACKVCRPPR